MISPFVRRLRLGNELKTLRLARDLTLEKLATQVDPTRQQMSRYELGHVPPDLDDIMQMLEALGVGIDDPRWEEIMTIAREAAERGWWEGNSKAIGERQALFANLEAGARRIRQYQQSFVPGLLQLPEFTRSRLEHSRWPQPPGATTEGVLKGRAGRQRLMRRKGGPAYEVILDEFAVRRRTAPAPIMRAQFEHMAAVAAEENSIEIRVLPLGAEVESYNLPVCSFQIYNYADPKDPVVVGVESPTTDTVLTEADHVAGYLEMYEALRAATLPIEDSQEFLRQAALALPSS
ncbi:helix-turn-helix transcriptional regulator [Actinocorallia sp. API 0066]|uniref:helix-turn-helix domain-containing protein n=1 Tax=Actinocorallia sp. API 0066 TaxID=2896846 RepID=UPI001E2F5439|nr:helix-turn-helix transcriptional regulator [Actinocorallia sp. API 0066]MCD0448323.1 helix-turn-helix transcriptional regulator [Actinocorallia sp. API 0066]